jgi:signal transduction histidine kinase
LELLGKDKLLTLEGDISPHVLVEGDELRLRQVMVNLIDNAIKYTPEGGTILLKVYAKRDKAFIEIIDTGIGISATALPQIFNRFFRAEEAKFARTEGSGLGLAIVHSITEAHRGSVHVESNENQGTKFRVELPLLRQEASKTNRALRMIA